MLTLKYQVKHSVTRVRIYEENGFELLALQIQHILKKTAKL